MNFKDGWRTQDKQIWISNLFSMSRKQWDMCAHIFQKVKTSTHKLWRRHRIFEKNLHHYEIIKIISRDYLSKRECSVQEEIYHILPELKLRRVFPAVHCFKTKIQEERMQVLSQKELNGLPYFHILLQIYLGNQILTSKLVDKMHYLVVENTVY